MPLIQFVEADGRDYEIDAPVGQSLMKVALDNGVDGILGECGGNCRCATCHCYIDPAFIPVLGEASTFEQDILAIVSEPKDNSRLACQVTVTNEMEGLVVTLPESQF